MNPAKWKDIKKNFSALLDLPESERTERLAQNADEEIRRELEKLLAAHAAAADFIEKPLLIERGLTKTVADDDLIGRQIENYLIENRIGAGGMGTVYLAERLNSDFKQKVALKVIKRGMDSEAIIKRFANERHILSRFRHSNIAQLLDGGISSDGLPFYVMEYVEGIPLNEFCARKELALNERLDIFRQICSAVDHAHKNLVIHRDLKPSNVLVTPDGTPKLLDFGIAKLLSADDLSDETLTQGRIFTPEYAAPEQILGKNVTTSADVYSLGVILYELLSGHRPFDTKGKSFEEIVKSVCETDPVRPSSVISGHWPLAETTKTNNEQRTTDDEQPKNHKSQITNPKSLAGDLDNIILKALRKEPAERYGSVTEFSEDVLRFLKGLPVLARPQTFKYRFEKYVRRHKAGVLAAALVLVSLIGGFSVATWQAFVARRERVRAEKRFADVRRLANMLLFEYQDELARLEGSTPIREKMIRDGLLYLDGILPESGDDPNLQLEIASAYQKIGDIQGNPFQPNLGKVEQAAESFDKAKEIVERLLAENPEKLETQRTAAKIFESRGSILLTKGDFAAAFENYAQSLSLYEKLSRIETEYLEATFGIAQVLRFQGFVFSRQGEPVKAFESFKRSLTKYEETVAKAPDVKKYQTGLAGAYLKLGDETRNQGDLRGALEYHRKTLQINTAILETGPTNVRFKRNVILALSRLAKNFNGLEELKEALAHSTKALQMQTEIAEADKQNMQYRSELGAYHIIQADIQAKLKDFAPARENALTSIKILSELVEKNPTETAAKSELGFALVTSAEVFEKSGYRADAIEFYRRALANLETEGVKNGVLPLIAKVYENLADLLLKSSPTSLTEPRDLYQKSLETLDALAQKGKLAEKDKDRPERVKMKLLKL